MGQDTAPADFLLECCLESEGRARGAEIGGKRQVPGLESLPRHPGRREFRPPSPEAGRTRPLFSPSENSSDGHLATWGGETTPLHNLGSWGFGGKGGGGGWVQGRRGRVVGGGEGKPPGRNEVRLPEGPGACLPPARPSPGLRPAARAAGNPPAPGSRGSAVPALAAVAGGWKQFPGAGFC